jgi:hypothetical protein
MTFAIFMKILICIFALLHSNMSEQKQDSFQAHPCRASIKIVRSVRLYARNSRTAERIFILRSFT